MANSIALTVDSLFTTFGSVNAPNRRQVMLENFAAGSFDSTAGSKGRRDTARK